MAKIEVSVTPEEHQRIRLAAEANSLKVATFVRQAALAAARATEVKREAAE